MARDNSNTSSENHRQAPNMKGKNPASPGQGGGQGDTRARSKNPSDWKDEPGNQS